MSLDLLGLVKGYFNNDMISKAASFLGEDSSVLQKGLDAVIPVSLAGIINKAETGNVSSLLSLAKTAYDSGVLGSLTNAFSQGGEGIPAIGPSLLNGLFGNKFGAVANAISSFTGLKGATTSSLLGTVVPVALASLGKYAGESNASPSAITSLLSGMKGSVLSSLPSGFNLSKLFDTPAAASVAHHAPEVKKNRNLLPILLTAAAGIILLLWLAKGCGTHKEEAAAVPEVTVDTPAAPAVTTPAKPVSFKVKLPSGAELDAYKGGIEDQLVAFLNDPNAQPGKDVWFDFNDLNFEFGTARIVPESQKQINNIVQILKEYPRAKIKIGGYTDKVGDEAKNKALSGERATAVAEALKAAGVGGQVEGAEGYGSAFAKYPADAPEEDRLKDRRVSVSVRAK